jgi:hypothetical protein
MVSLRSFHLFFISISIVLASGVGAWGLINRQILLGVVSLALGLLLIAYGCYFVAKVRTPIEAERLNERRAG